MKKNKADQKASPKSSRFDYTTPVYIGGGFYVSFRMKDDNSVQCQWSPNIPTQKELQTLTGTFGYRNALMRYVADGVKL
ncbi:MAG: hypothetical protein ACJAXR_000936 [Halopseudomonas sp.]|jgi:hypothetical protein|uniref:hypothetical protein n=1 Tax=Halopseudomonas sp. TaxID=2901191 RepID=UPI0039E56D99